MANNPTIIAVLSWIAVKRSGGLVTNGKAKQTGYKKSTNSVVVGWWMGRGVRPHFMTGDIYSHLSGLRHRLTILSCVTGSRGCCCILTEVRDYHGGGLSSGSAGPWSCVHWCVWWPTRISLQLSWTEKFTVQARINHSPGDPFGLLPAGNPGFCRYLSA